MYGMFSLAGYIFRWKLPEISILRIRSQQLVVYHIWEWRRRTESFSISSRRSSRVSGEFPFHFFVVSMRSVDNFLDSSYCPGQISGQKWRHSCHTKVLAVNWFPLQFLCGVFVNWFIFPLFDATSSSQADAIFHLLSGIDFRSLAGSVWKVPLSSVGIKWVRFRSYLWSYFKSQPLEQYCLSKLTHFSLILENF